MLLKSLEISGFKSFAKKTVLEFSTSISAIVGPNGSGKSNVAEAFRFVLGEQSIKSMRGKRGEDLIFNGGKTLPRSNRASVKLIFDNRARVFPIDFDEVIIERSVHRDGINEYSLNGSQVRLKDISELLFSAHIGSSGHHIISQGEADRMLSSSSKERRGMLEDALGLKTYQIKKEESERKLLKTGENIASVESLRREIAPHLRFLKKQVEKYEKALILKDELAKLYLLYFKIEHQYVSTEKVRIVNSKTIPEEHLHELKKELILIKETLSQKDEHSQKSEEIIELEQQTSEVRTQKEALNRQVGGIDAEISYVHSSIRKEEASAEERERKTILLSEVTFLQKEIDDYAERAENSDDVTELREMVMSIKSACLLFIETRAASSKESDERKVRLVAELEEKMKFKQDIEYSITKLGHKEKTLRDAQDTIKREMEKKKDDTFEAEKKMLAVMSSMQDIENTLSTLRLEEERMRLIEEEMKRDLYEAGMLIGREVLEFQTTEIEFDLHEERVQQVDRRREVERKKIRLEEAGIGNSAEIIKEAEEVEARDAFLEKELADLNASSLSLRSLISELEIKIDTEFREGIEKINKEFENFFKLMFGGGNAALKLIKPEKKMSADEESDSEDDSNFAPDFTKAMSGKQEEEGIEIDVALPHKKTKGLVMLSGGERALTSIALLFALSQVNPPPFIILDETDAALDEANSKKYGDMIERLSSHSGLILITHNRETMSRAGIIYGVTMGSEGFSKLLSIQFEEAVSVAK